MVEVVYAISFQDHRNRAMFWPCLGYLRKSYLAESPLVSVTILPNRPDLLGRAVDQCFKQTYHNIEILVIDDNDPDSKARIGLSKS